MMSEIERIVSVYWSDEEAEVWWSHPHPMLDGKSARETIESGDVSSVFNMLKLLDDAAYV